VIDGTQTTIQKQRYYRRAVRLSGLARTTNEMPQQQQEFELQRSIKSKHQQQ